MVKIVNNIVTPYANNINDIKNYNNGLYRIFKNKSNRKNRYKIV